MHTFVLANDKSFTPLWLLEIQGVQRPVESFGILTILKKEVIKINYQTVKLYGKITFKPI